MIEKREKHPNQPKPSIVENTFKSMVSRISNFGKEHLSYWGCALAGEVGELCNMIKKMERDGTSFPEKDLAHELADIFIYTELTSRALKIDLESAIMEKIEIVKKRRESVINDGSKV